VTPRVWAVRGGMTLWVCAMLFLGAWTMAKHNGIRPLPDELQPLDDMVSVYGDDVMLHILDARCSCTRTLTDALVRQAPVQQGHEQVVFIGDDDASVRKLSTRYPVQHLTSQELLARTGVDVAPVAVVRRRGQLVYVGGYYRTPSPVHPQLDALVAVLDDAETLRPLPIYGCSTDENALW